MLEESKEEAARRKKADGIEQEIQEILSNFKTIHGPEVTSTVAGLVRAASFLEQNMQLIAYFSKGKVSEEELLQILRMVEFNGKSVISILAGPSFSQWTPELRKEANTIVGVCIAILSKLRT